MGWSWFPEDDHIVVRTNQAQVANKLARRVTGRYSNVPLSQILADLASKSDINLRLEPGMMTRLPASTAQSYTLALQGMSVRQALELIAAETGLKYEIEPEGIYMSLAESTATGATASGTPVRSGGPYAVKISIPAKDNTFSYEFFLREDELPQEFLDHRREIKEQFIQKMMTELAPDEKIRNGGDQK